MSSDRRRSPTGPTRGSPWNPVAVILGGGRGSRLMPLTRDRSKPAVPVAGKYRLVDVPISNCINSGIRHIFLLTQFNSVSLHKHVQDTYRFDSFANGFVRLLAAQQTLSGDIWYQGTADAVRQHLSAFMSEDADAIIILSGDQLYRMDFRRVLQQHNDTGADATICTVPVGRSEAASFGIMQLDANHRINRFVEKPATDAELTGLSSPLHEGDDHFLASMGIYIFRPDVLAELLAADTSDFGRDIIPDAIADHNVYGYVFDDYWRDIGTIDAFWEANLALTEPLPAFSLHDTSAPIYTHMRFLPPSKILKCNVDHSLLSEGCIINCASIVHSVIGVRARVGERTSIDSTYVMGADHYDIMHHGDEGIPVGIGPGCEIRNAIIDKGARIGRDVKISPEGKPTDVDEELYSVHGGVIVIPKNAVIPDGTVL